MAEVSQPGHTVVGGRTRAAAISISIAVGIAVLFLIFVGRQQFWSWRLALFGALGGFTAYVFCHFLDKTLGDWIRRRRLMADKAVGVPLYFVGGCASLLVTTGLLQALGLMPFDLDKRDLRIAFAISGGISIVVGLLFYSFELMRRRLGESIERIKEQEFAEKELALARSIQSRLLPPEEITGEGYRIKARNLPARFVAGDFYDVFPLSHGTVGIVVADVSGKGMGAALIMASVKAVVPLVAAGRDAAETLVELNRKLETELARREFVALCFARFDPSSGALEMANAGLPDPYLLRTDGRVETLSVNGPRLPLGMRPEIVYESLTVSLESGDRVLVLTDGLPEALMPGGEPFGYERLLSVVTSAMPQDDGSLDRFLEAVHAATPGVLRDDWTALLLERRASGGDLNFRRNFPRSDA
jgi:hypothetical protein